MVASDSVRVAKLQRQGRNRVRSKAMPDIGIRFVGRKSSRAKFGRPRLASLNIHTWDRVRSSYCTRRFASIQPPIRRHVPEVSPKASMQTDEMQVIGWME